MDAMIRKIQINPAKRDKDNEITKDESAVVTLEFPMDNQVQKDGIKRLFDLLSEEYIECNIDEKIIEELGSGIRLAAASA